MKRFLSVVALITPLLSFAQIEKGTFLVSGNFSYQKNADNPNAVVASVNLNETSQISFTPYLGFLVSSKVAVGLLANYGKAETKYSPVTPFSTLKYVDEMVTAGPFVRYYQAITERFYFFAQGDVQFGKNESSATTADPDVTPFKAEIKSTAIAIRPGISYFVSKRWAIELILGSVSYAKRDFKSDNTSKDMDGFTFNFLTRGLSPGVVFTF